jgi:Flp pilus assembly pilin Flp
MRLAVERKVSHVQHRFAESHPNLTTVRAAAFARESTRSLLPKGGESQMLKFFFDRFAREEDGQTMAEYGVVLAVITAGIILALGALSGAIGAALDAVTAML